MNNEQEERYQKALQLMTDEKWLAASSLLEDLINESPSDDVTKALVLALYRAKQYARAFVYFTEQPEVFTGDKGHARLAVYLLLHNQSYITARLFITDLPLDWQAEFEGLIAEAERTAEEKFQTTIQTALRSFYHLGDCPLSEQQERLGAARQLPLTEYLTGAQFLLRDPYAHQLIKAALVDTLRQLGIDRLMALRWLDGREYSINPAKLPAIEELPVVQDLHQALAARLANQNPSEYQLASQELQLQLMLLYPLIENKVIDADGWIDCLVGQIQGEKVSGQPAILATQRQLNQVIDDLGEKP
ncbi:hypothetical protein [Limosilactobacillus antri]|uniref:hypothetical protein n=1 Tax=Limosilactobacillus antri TaxID=227943 RepID=UPI001F58AD87|nr:hypothetical protein [Limosilactobacillus antri]